MKPYLLVLLLAVPLLVYNILACDAADATEVAPAMKSESSTPAAHPARPCAPAGAATGAKPTPNPRSVPSHAKSWFM
ncbi:MAG: hypothetical protein JWM88_3514 [Verrucomicrobia bacterium]|nr:hypothetical protein [Verrucomicrobiota bacterium]